MESKGSKAITISVPVEVSDWLDNHKEINRSKLFQDAVLYIMQNKRKISPILLLASVMGISFSVLLIITSIGLASFVGFYMSTVMFILGVASLGITISVIVNVRRNATTNAIQ